MLKKLLSRLLAFVVAVGLWPACAAEDGSYNEKDLAAYAACVNSLAVEYQVPCILWDCSVHVNRSELKVNAPIYFAPSIRQV